MLENKRQQWFDDLVASATTEELIWMTGFLSGTLAGRKNKRPLISTAITENPVTEPLRFTIVYGTETGNAKSLAGKISAFAKKEKAIANVISLEQYNVANLSRERLLIVIISTHGDGEPPAAARNFYDSIHSSNQQLTQLRFGVIALGDSSYPQFCQTGKEVDQRLHELGAKRIVSAQLCDTDYEQPALQWFERAFNLVRENKATETSQAFTTDHKTNTPKRQYHGVVRRSINLNDIGSDKETYHIEILAKDVNYQPGDSLALVPRNPISVVEKILEITNVSPDETIKYRNETLSVVALLQNRLNISYLPVRVLKNYANIVGQYITDSPISLFDLLRIYPIKDTEQFFELLQLLEPITPRLYSIASSPSTHTGEIHITVTLDKFYIDNKVRFGLCSGYLASFPVNSELTFNIHVNNRFRLPPAQKDIIMICAGTGIAPFRSFIAERHAQGADGRNWLFFGDQRFTTDFLYQTEWQSHLESGVLTRMTTAFSRDQQEKIYVQHKLKTEGKSVYEWLEDGAYVYVCGAKDSMGKDVEQALIELIAENSNDSLEKAREYLQMLEESERYLKDLY